MILEVYPQAITLLSICFLSIQFKPLKVFFEGNLQSQISNYPAFVAIFLVLAKNSILFTVMDIRNSHRLPQAPGLTEKISQYMAISVLLTPKIVFVANAISFVPYLFPVPYLMEYGLVILYNWMIFGDFRGKYQCSRIILLKNYICLVLKGCDSVF